MKMMMMMTMMIVMMATVTWIAVVLVFDSFYCCSSFLWVAFHGSHTVSSCACKSGSQCTESSTGGGAEVGYIMHSRLAVPIKSPLWCSGVGRSTCKCSSLNPASLLQGIA